MLSRRSGIFFRKENTIEMKMDEDEEETLLDVQHSPLFKLKRKVLILSLFFNFFLIGLEYSITIPAAFLFGGYTVSNKVFMLLEVALYPLAAMFSSFIFGHLYDRTKQIRKYLIILNTLQAIGNFIYAINYSRWLPLIGRLISGIGDAFIPMAISEITYLYEPYDRTGMICVLELGRVLGFILGPIVDYFITYWLNHYYWMLTSKTLPGFIMGCCWIAMIIITVCCVHNLSLEVIEKYNLNDSPFLPQKTYFYDGGNLDKDSEEDEDDDIEDQEENNPFVNSNNLIPEKLEDDSEKMASDIAKIVSEKHEVSNDHMEDNFFNKRIKDANDIFPIPEPPPKKETLTKRLSHSMKRRYSNFRNHIAGCSDDFFSRSHLNEFMHLDVSLLLFINLVFWFSQSSFLMFCSFVPMYEYKWTLMEIGITYSLGFILIIAMFTVMYFIRASIYRKNIYLFVVSMFLLLISLCLVIYEEIPNRLGSRMIVFSFAALLLFTSIPLSLVCFRTLLTNISRPGLQGTLQGLSESIARFALVIGLLLSTVTVHFRLMYGATMAAIIFIAIVLFFLTYDSITKKQRKKTGMLIF